ncbi:MAG: hypothetical protein KIT31_37940, partial [Deltaproteobacteria bacterium]|nr:hypothetical protein [Deltaproteobacteria bacterium]
MQLASLHQLLAGLVRRTWVIALVAIITCAAFAAKAVAALVEADYLTDDRRAPAAPVAPPKKAPPPPAQIDGRVLVDRNIFCSECTPALPVAPTGAVDAPYSGLPVVLIATSLGEDASATVHVPSTGTQGSWSLGDTIPGVGTIAKIGPTYIDVVDTNQKRGRISLL